MANAITTKARRASATLFLVPSYAVGVFPDSIIGRGDRRAASWVYQGLDASEIITLWDEVSGASGTWAETDETDDSWTAPGSASNTWN